MVSANKTRKLRPCLHGERLANGKCPTKRKPCATGPRLANGKCLPKPCKHGERLANGKCPPSKKKRAKASSSTAAAVSGSSAVCFQDMTYEECETTILRTFIKESDEINKKEMRSEDVDKMVDILESFIKKEKCICYGGLAINNILPTKTQFYDRSSEIPDYDFYSPDAQHHAKTLANIFFKNGFEEVEAKSGVHPNTFKVFVNFISVADITFMHPRLFQELQKHAIKKNDILYCPPDYLRMSMYLELSRPRGDVSRWEKVYKRLKLLNEYYPYNQPCIENTQMANVNPYNDIIRNEFIRQQVVFFGGFAFEQYEQNDYPFEMFVLALEPDKTVSKVVEVLKQNGFTGAKFIEIYKKEVVEYIGKHYLIVVEEKVVAIVFSAVACHSYHEIDYNNHKVRIATVFTILSYYLLFLFMNEIYLDHAKLSCMAKRMFEIEQKHKLNGKGLMKTLSLTCYGKQTTLRDMFSLKNFKYKQLGRLPNKTQEQWEEYNSFFFKYIPKQNAQHNMLQHQYRKNNGNSNGHNNGNNNGSNRLNDNNSNRNNNGNYNGNNNGNYNGNNNGNYNGNNNSNRNYNGNNNGNNNSNRNYNGINRNYNGINRNNNNGNNTGPR